MAQRELITRLFSATESDLQHRANWYVNVRWLFLLAIAVPGILSNFIGEGFSAQVKRDTVLAAVALTSNLVFFALSRLAKDNDNYYRPLVTLFLLVDILTITILIFTKGGVESRSPILYAIPILISSALFARRGVYAAGIISIVLYDSLILLDHLDIIHSIGAVSPSLRLDSTYTFNTIAFFTSALFIIAILADFITQLLKKKERQALESKEAILGLLADLTKEKAFVEQQRTKDEALLASIGDGVFAVNSQQKIILFNDAAVKITGFEASEVLGKKFKDVLNFLDELTGKSEDSFIKTALSGTKTKLKGNKVLVHKNGKRIPVEDSAAPIMDQRKRIAGAIVVFRDVSKERQLQRAKDEFVALASHQLRTPATAVKNFVGLIQQGYAGKVSSEQAKYVDMAYESNERQLEIIDDLLKLAQADSGQIKLNLVQADLKQVIDSAVFEQSGLVAQRKQTIKVNMPSKPIDLTFDIDNLRMVISNLISNASKYMSREGKISITVRDNRQTVTIAIKDTGVGIAKKDIRKLFKKFSRIDNKLSTEVGGSGIGLYLAKRLVDLHRGRITVQSVIGKGSTFSVILPKQSKTTKE